MKDKAIEEIQKVLKEHITLHTIRQGYGVFNITGFKTIAVATIQALNKLPAQDIIALFPDKNIWEIDPDAELPKSPYRYYSKRERTSREQEESFCDIGYNRALQDMADWVKKKDGVLQGW